MSIIYYNKIYRLSFVKVDFLVMQFAYFMNYDIFYFLSMYVFLCDDWFLFNFHNSWLMGFNLAIFSGMVHDWWRIVSSWYEWFGYFEWKVGSHLSPCYIIMFVSFENFTFFDKIKFHLVVNEAVWALPELLMQPL